jgi:hypothetical protein
MKNILLANQKQIVNVFAANKPRYTRRPAKSEGQIIRTVYQNIPIFNPLPHHQQPVGTMSETNAAIHALIKSNNELREHQKQSKPARVSFLDVGADDTTMQMPLSSIHSSTPRYMNSTFASSSRGTNLFDDLNATTMSARTESLAEGGGGTIRYKKDGTPAKKPGRKPKDSDEDS